MVDAGGVVIWLGSAREDLVRGTVSPGSIGLAMPQGCHPAIWGLSHPLQLLGLLHTYPVTVYA